MCRVVVWEFSRTRGFLWKIVFKKV